MSNAEPIWEDMVTKFAEAILHGDKEHQAWLRQAAKDFCALKEIQPVRGTNKV